MIACKPFLFCALFTAATAFASVQSDLMALAPAGTTLLTGIDVTRTVSSPFGLYMLNQMRGDDRRLQEFIAATGFDPTRDLQQMLVAGVAGKSGPNSRFAILAQGIFDEARIHSTVVAKGGTVSTINGTQTLLIQKRHGDGTVALAFPRPGLAVLADPQTMEEVLSSNRSQTLDAQLIDQVNHVGAENDIWFATLMSGSFLGRELGNAAPGDVANGGALKSILRSSGGMQFGNTVAMSLDLFTRSPDDARSVTDLLRFVSNFVQMQQNNPRASAAALALSGMQVQTEGSTVHAFLNMNEQQLEQFVQAGKNPPVRRQ